MVGWHHRLNGHEFGWTPGVGDGQRGLACCSLWGCKESDTTEQLNWLKIFLLFNHLSHLILCDPMDCSTPGCPVLIISQSLLKFMSIESVMSYNHLIPCCPLILWPSVFFSIRVFCCELALCIKWPKYWNFSFSISPSNNILGLFPLGLTGLISLKSKGLSRVPSSTIWECQFFGAQPFLGSISYLCTWLLERP